MEYAQPKLLNHLQVNADGIFGNTSIPENQAIEHSLREAVASIVYENYLDEISKHHSISVMDEEVKLFVKNIPTDGIICDVGGCWGWHWRNIHAYRPDINVVIIDFVRSNLFHAQNLLKERVNKNIWLVHGDATKLDFSEAVFDGYWTVQTIQHIPDISLTLHEAYRTLKFGGIYVNYSLNNSMLMKFIYSLFKKKYVIDGYIDNRFYLRRAGDKEKNIVEKIFRNKVHERFTEIIFKPEFKFAAPGKSESLLGWIDTSLSTNTSIFSMLYRQRAIQTTKSAQHITLP